MKKHVLGLCAAVMLASGLSTVPAVSAASSTTPPKNKWTSSTIEADTNSGTDVNAGTSEDIEKVITDGMKYIGTPYEFGSNRSTSTTFDCSDFIRWIFKETIGVTLPADSRQQGEFVQDNGTAETDWHKLKRGDLLFFMSYKGSKAENYENIDKQSQRITHVALYLGDGQILHTYSNDSGGVLLGDITDGQWEHRFLFGGSVLPK
ncbi:C40 family peptidase [Cohnella cholangitidis]|uniref:NlpC/P60 family protein n=1 Tax=Cohnella cholangitidis TaxID=2598458 RepID=A0A7G5BVN3_9BACL|nr:C40 family peptidase [Cohnella cholangitidis]QMV41017.1 NlpC/P60 family protein [Cohnella cholangitidis]